MNASETSAIERTYQMLIADARRGLIDVAAGKVKDARSALAEIKRRRQVKK
jgi:hypothetical protein